MTASYPKTRPRRNPVSCFFALGVGVREDVEFDSAHAFRPVGLFLDVVYAYFKHNRASSYELIVCLAQGGHLFRSATGEAGGVECQ